MILYDDDTKRPVLHFGKPCHPEEAVGVTILDPDYRCGFQLNDDELEKLITYLLAILYARMYARGEFDS